MKALVTGSNGFIGSTLVEKLLQQGHQVTCLVRRQSNLTWLQNLPVTYSYASLSSGEGLEQAVAGMDWIFHLAGVTKARDRQGYVDGNVTITTRLLQACRSQPGLKKFVYVSSQAAAGPSLAGIPLTEADAPHPISIYGECKLAAEKEVLSISGELPVVVLRPPSVYGPETATFWFTFRMSTGDWCWFWAKAISESVWCMFQIWSTALFWRPNNRRATAKCSFSPATAIMIGSPSAGRSLGRWRKKPSPSERRFGYCTLYPGLAGPWPR